MNDPYAGENQTCKRGFCKPGDAEIAGRFRGKALRQNGTASNGDIVKNQNANNQTEAAGRDKNGFKNKSRRMLRRATAEERLATGINFQRR